MSQDHLAFNAVLHLKMSTLLINDPLQSEESRIASIADVNPLETGLSK